MAIATGALGALTFVPFKRLSRPVAYVQDNRGNVAVYLVTIGASIVVAFLVARS